MCFPSAGRSLGDERTLRRERGHKENIAKSKNIILYHFFNFDEKSSPSPSDTRRGLLNHVKDQLFNNSNYSQSCGYQYVKIMEMRRVAIRVCNGWTRPRLKRSELQTKPRGLGLLSINTAPVRSQTVVLTANFPDRNRGLGFWRLYANPGHLPL